MLHLIKMWLEAPVVRAMLLAKDGTSLSRETLNKVSLSTGI
jgi:hypothetical protein